MTKAQEIQIRQSEIRQKINGLLALDERTDEQRAELETLTGEVQKLEPELRAALAAEPDPTVTPTDPGTADPETRERLRLRVHPEAGFGVGFVRPTLRGQLPAGAAAEYLAACGVKDGYPLDSWEQDRPQPELRADAATPAPATGTGATLAPVQPYIFAESIAPMLGIEMPSVGSGSYSEATITTALSAAAVAKGSAKESTAAVLTPVTASPRRISARLSLTLEDVATIGQDNFEAALRQNAQMALSDGYDNECINGDASGNRVNGLIAQLTNPDDPAVVSDFDAFVAAYTDAIDGLWARTTRDVFIVANVDAYKLAAKTFRDRVINVTETDEPDSARAGVSLGEVSFADYAAKMTGGLVTNSRMPATASTIARGLIYRRGRPGLRTACHPTWGTVTIDDIYSDSGSGIRHFTLNVLVGDRVLLVQPSAYSLVEFKVAAA